MNSLESCKISDSDIVVRSEVIPNNFNNAKLQTCPEICSSNIDDETIKEPVHKNSAHLIEREKFSSPFKEVSKEGVFGDIISDGKNKLSITVVTEDNVKRTKRYQKRHKNLTILDSDSENEADAPKEIVSNIIKKNESNELKTSSKNNTSKRMTIIDTDSESEDITPHNKSFTHTLEEIKTGETEIESTKACDNNVKNERVGSSANSNSESEDTGKAVVSKVSPIDKTVQTTVQKSRLAMLCDSDSDEEPDNEETNSLDVTSDDEIISQSQHANKIKTETFTKKKTSKAQKKSKSKKADVEKNKKMTPKEAAELRKEIRSESQRMTREKNVSLPYHKPKAHSLQEFLARRPKFAMVVPRDQAPPSVAIKMSTEQLEIISKKLKAREKKVKEFYQSESESGNEDDFDYVPPSNGTNKSDEEAKQTSKTLQDQGNTKANIILTNSLEDDTEPPTENETYRKKVETESLMLENDDSQKSKIIPNDIDNCRDAVQHCIELLEETADADKTTPENKLMETNDIPETEQYKEYMNGQEEVQQLSQAACNNISQQVGTENYDFQLDDEATENFVSTESQQATNLEKDLETVLEKGPITLQQEQKTSSKRFIYTDLDREIENYGNLEKSDCILEQNFVDVLPPVKSKLNVLKERLANIKPRLSGGPDKVIDLDSTVAKPKEVVELMERFTKHMTSKKHNSKHKVKLSIVTVESGGDIHKETVAVNVDSDDEGVIEEKPGAKLQRLKEELQKQMDQKKSEIWQQKAARGIREVEKTKDVEQDINGEKDGFYYGEEEEEEAEMTEEEDTEEEFEDDIQLSNKPRKKSEFLDEEAEESGEEEPVCKEDYEEATIEESEDKRSENPAEDNEDSNIITEPTSATPLDPKHEGLVEKRVLRRIVKPDDDSDEEELFSDAIPQKTTNNEQLDSTVTADEEDIPPHQTRQLDTPMRQAVSQTKSISDFLTPISFITSIQNLASATKNRPAISPFRMHIDQSPITEERSVISQKKLFTDSQVADSQESLVTQTEESSLDLRQDNETVFLSKTQLENNDETPNTQDLIGICSGEFTGVTQLEPSDVSGKPTEYDGSQSSELKNLGTDQDMIISQLLDEEELENFKKKFESPINTVTQRTVLPEAQEITGGGVIDSDDEDKEEYGLRKKKNQRRIQFSDDESSTEENNDSEGEIDLHDDEEVDNIGYDSEENEIDLNEMGKKEKMKISDFLEAEAELSESDWGSEDEDENDLDKLEFELGDTEKFDEEQVKEDLEKIHLRRMLDDDAREVKLLQEVLLEDGEMHGTGRQRQFKWKNIDLNDDGTEEIKDDDDIFLDVEESEEQWRKKRHEREMFLKEKLHKSQQSEFEDSDLLNNSQLLKIGQKVLQRSRSQNSSQNNTPAETTNSVPDEHSKVSFNILSKRGSFLSRSDQVLQRVAEYTKVTADVSFNSNKTTKNFVFQSASVSEVSILSAEVKKRKASDGTPNVIKKLRLNTDFNTPNKNSPLQKSKKLFNF